MKSAAQDQRFTERGAECCRTHVQGYTGPMCSCGAGLCLATRDESENQRFNPAPSAATALEPCDCGSARENHGWACRCDNPPSRRQGVPKGGCCWTHHLAGGKCAEPRELHAAK